MKKQFLNLGKALSKAEQKQISGGVSKGSFNPCPCTDNYTSLPGGDCTYPGKDPNFPDGVCLGTIQNGLCCI